MKYREFASLSKDKVKSIYRKLTQSERELFELLYGNGSTKSNKKKFYTIDEIAYFLDGEVEEIKDRLEKLERKVTILLQEIESSQESQFPDVPFTTAPEQSLDLLIDPGSATQEDIAELFYEISKLYRMLGGDGIEFVVEGGKVPTCEEVGL